MPTPGKTEASSTTAPREAPEPEARPEPAVPGEPPVRTEPAVPPGASYAAKATKMDAGSYHEVPTKELGPEFPLTPSARSHSVTEERLADKAVIDRGDSPEETGHGMPSDAAAAPRSKAPPGSEVEE